MEDCGRLVGGGLLGLNVTSTRFRGLIDYGKSLTLHNPSYSVSSCIQVFSQKLVVSCALIICLS